MVRTPNIPVFPYALFMELWIWCRDYHIYLHIYEPLCLFAGSSTYFNDTKVRTGILKTAEIAGHTIKMGDERHYLLANVALVGEAIMLAMPTNIRKWYCHYELFLSNICRNISFVVNLVGLNSNYHDQRNLKIQ